MVDRCELTCATELHRFFSLSSERVAVKVDLQGLHDTHHAPHPEFIWLSRTTSLYSSRRLGYRITKRISAIPRAGSNLSYPSQSNLYPFYAFRTTQFSRYWSKLSSVTSISTSSFGNPSQENLYLSCIAGCHTQEPLVKLVWCLIEDRCCGLLFRRFNIWNVESHFHGTEMMSGSEAAIWSQDIVGLVYDNGK
jgi:hypothetical protein